MVQTQAIAAPGMQPMAPPVIDAREPIYLNPGPTNRLVLSLKSGLPSHIDWALSRLTFASSQQPEALLLEAFPGLIEALLSFPFRLVLAVTGAPAEAWEPAYFEQDERQYDGLAQAGIPDAQALGTDEDNDADSDASTDDGETAPGGSAMTRVAISKGMGNSRSSSLRFDPLRTESHARLLRNAISATLVLRNTTLNGRNENIFFAFSRAINTLVRDLLHLPLYLPTGHAPAEFAELEGAEELRVYALDILELTRSRLSLRRPLPILFNTEGRPLEPAMQFASILETRRTEVTDTVKEPSLRTAEQIFILLVYHLHTSNDRSVLIGTLRCLGAIAGEEKNQVAFVEHDVRAEDATSRTDIVISPGILRKCLSLLPLTQDSPLLEAALDCMYQIIVIADNALRLGVVGFPQSSNPVPLQIGVARHASAGEDASNDKTGLDDVRSVIKMVARLLVAGRVVWERYHPLTLHPALHLGIPSALDMRQKEHAALQRKRRKVERDERIRAKTRKLQRAEWLRLKDIAEPDRLKAWLKVIYEPRAHSEVSQMEFWTSYSSTFGPYSQLGGPKLQPAAEVIRTVSSVFPGAAAMVLLDKRFVVRGVDARDRSFLRRFECQWRGCDAPDNDTHAAMIDHVHKHTEAATSGVCSWDKCTFEVPQDRSLPWKEHLDMHVMTHLPESEEQIQSRVNTSSAAVKVVNGAQSNGTAAPLTSSTEAASKSTMTYEKLDAERVIKLHNPVPGTIDCPEMLTFCVTRTPMDPNTGRPLGMAATASLIIRTLARTTASVLSKAEARRREQLESLQDAEAKASQAEANGAPEKEPERFGFPMSQLAASKPMMDAVSDNVDKTGSGDSAQYVWFGICADAPATEDVTPATTAAHAAWTEPAALHIMSALLDCEEDMMCIASENDILCPALTDALGVMQAHRGQSMLDRDALAAAQNILVGP